MANKLVETSKEKSQNPSRFSLKMGQSCDFKGIQLTLISFTLREEVLPHVMDARIHVVYKGKVWDFDMAPSDTKTFDDQVVQYIRVNLNLADAFESELVFSVFPKNDMLK